MYGEGEEGLGVGLVLQREVPPLGADGLEAVTEHGLAENHAVAELLGSEGVVGTILARLRVAATIGVALITKPVEGSTHVDLFLSTHVEEGEVDRRATRVTALLGDIAEAEEVFLVDLRIEIGTHQRVVEVFAPADEMVDGTLGTVGVIDFDAVPLLDELVADSLQAVGGFLCHQGRGLLVTVNPGADEVVGTEITYLQNGIRHHVGDIHKTGRTLLDGSEDFLGPIAGNRHQATNDYEDG